MKNLLFTTVLGLSISAFAAQTNSPAPQPSSNTNVPSQAGALRVNSPKANEKIAQNYVHVTYQLTDRGVTPAPSPNFSVQLDGNDPVTTTSYDYTFTGLAPGVHTITVTLVDANGLPIANSSVSTKFTVVDGNGGARSPSSQLSPAPHLKLASSEVTPLPDGGTALPLLSLVGFAVLIGGISTAIKNR